MEMQWYFCFLVCILDIKKEKFYNDWKKIGAVHLVKSYGGEGRRYPEVPWVKYLVLPKCGTKYQK